MMRAPLRAAPRGAPKVRGASVPAPVGGWNAVSALSDMKPSEAVLLDNWFPGTASCRIRGGFASYATGMGAGSVESLMVWGGSTQKMLACANNAVYDVSSTGAVGAALASGFTSNRWQHVNMGTAGGQFVIAVNGSDAPWNFNGTVVSTTPAITGVTASDLVNVESYKQRLFFCENATLKFWYLPVNSIGGAASSFDLSSLCKLGGYLMAIGTWTRDGGAGPDDLIVFVTSMGEVVVYTGTDPSNAAAWSLVGIFRMGAPVGRRCLIKLAGDLVAVTQDGFVSLAQSLPAAGANNAAAISFNIANATTSAVQSYGGNFGWQPFLYPKGNMVLFNVPVAENSSSHQYVMNTITRAWSRFTGQNANCWALYNDRPYFGGNAGVVYNADSGYSDDGANITADVKTAFNYFKAPGRLKHFKMVRPVLATNGTMTAALALNLDFEDRVPSTTPTFSGAEGAEWDVSDWDTSDWGDDDQVQKDWQSVVGVGYCAALRMQIATNSLSVAWTSVDYLLEDGSFL